MKIKDIDQLCSEYGCFLVKNYITGSWTIYNKASKSCLRLADETLHLMTREEIENKIVELIWETVL